MPSSPTNAQYRQRPQAKVCRRGEHANHLDRESSVSFCIARDDAGLRLLGPPAGPLSQRNQTVNFFGRPSSSPMVVAPAGAAGLLWFDGEIEIARAAAHVGVPFTLSTASIVSMERVADGDGGRLWFQLYMGPDRRLSMELVDRARKAGYEVLRSGIPVLENCPESLRAAPALVRQRVRAVRAAQPGARHAEVRLAHLGRSARHPPALARSAHRQGHPACRGRRDGGRLRRRRDPGVLLQVTMATEVGIRAFYAFYRREMGL